MALEDRTSTGATGRLLLHERQTENYCRVGKATNRSMSADASAGA